MKCERTLVLVAALLLTAFFLFNPVFGQPTQYTVKLDSYSLQVTCPAEVTPGDNVAFNVQGTPIENGVYLQSLTAIIYYADASGLHQLQTENLIVSTTPNAYNNYMSYAYSGPFSRNFTVNVPADTPNASLVAVFAERILSKYQGWTTPAYQVYPSYPYPYNPPNNPYYPYNPNNPSYPYNSNNPYYPYNPSNPYYPYNPPNNPYYPYNPYDPSFPYRASYLPPSTNSSLGWDQAVAQLSYIQPH